MGDSKLAKAANCIFFRERIPKWQTKIKTKKGGKKERNHKVVRSRFILTTLNTVTFFIGFYVWFYCVSLGFPGNTTFPSICLCPFPLLFDFFKCINFLTSLGLFVCLICFLCLTYFCAKAFFFFLVFLVFLNIQF